MKKLSSLFFGLLVTFLAQAQTGNYFLSHFSPTKEHFDNICFDIAQDDRGVMYFANKAGLLLFDGRNWDMIKGYSAIYSVNISEDNSIFWSGAKGFGQVIVNREGFQELKLLSDSTTSDVFQTLVVNEHAYFLTEKTIYHYNSKTQSITKILSPSDAVFYKLFELFGAVYINTSSGVLKVEGGKLSPSRIGINSEVVFSSKIENHYVIGTADNQIWTCGEDLVFKQVKIQDQQYADASVIINGSWLHQQLLALGTLRGGVMFINPITGRTEEIINYNTGLPDNEIFALKQDHNQNTWVAHEYGFTRISPQMPFKSFSHYDGLEGNLLCANSFKGSVYVGTSLGLFKLQKEDVYEELVYYVNVEVAQPKKPVAKNPEKQEVKSASEIIQSEKAEPQQQTESKKKGLFNFLKRNKRQQSSKEEPQPAVTQQQSTKSEVVPQKEQEKTAEELPTYKRVKKTERILRASHYVFRKVQGIDAKVMHLLEVNGKLIASGLGGIFEVADLNSKPVLQEPVRYLYSITQSNKLFASTYEDDIKSISLEKDKWIVSNDALELDDQVDYIFQGKNSDLWLCGLNKIYQYDTKAASNAVRAFELSNPDMESTVGAIWDEEKLLFANADGFYSLDVKGNQLSKIDSLPEPSQYFAFKGSILYHDRHGWHLAGNNEGHGNIQLLNLFQNFRFIATDHASENLWMISAGNELYKFFADKIRSEEAAFPLFLKTVTNDNLITANKSKIHISEDKSAVTFEIVQPDFVSPEAIEFRYMLRGMKEEWSEWASNNNRINFPYLPPGEYTLEVESRNVFGAVTQLEPVKFEVLPPYWQRSWFYAMEFAFIATLVLLSFRLNARYRIVSRILSLLTIILLIQFLQTVINSNLRFSEDSPVIDFIIQVFVALLVLPVEGYLRNLMFRSLDSSSRFYKFIMPKAAVAGDKGKFESFDIEDDDTETR